jgi:hypothetical protein
MQQALLALWGADTIDTDMRDAITALRKVLEQQAEPTPWRDMIVVTLVREGINKHRARELADHFAAQPEPTCPECKAAVLYECVACSSNNYPPAAKQEQEPVAYYHPHKGFYWAKPTHISAPTVVDVPPVPLYVKWKAAQRPWQGLTDDEIAALDWQHATVDAECVRAIEKLLKEKNHD